MESATNNSRPAILEKAWMHHAELDTNADKLSKHHLSLRRWVIILGVVATFLAIVTDTYSTFYESQCQVDSPPATCAVQLLATLRVLLILTPLIGSMIAAFTSRELGDGRWLSMRAGAEEIKKEIYIYRTVLTNHPHRNKWLSNRLAYIQRQIFKASGRRMDTEPYKGTLPLYYSPNNPDSDAGFSDLTAEQYIRYRLQEQLSWHEKRIIQLSKAKRNLTIAILLSGAAGAFLAALGNTASSFTVWVALTASITAALSGWEELRNRDKTILNYSKVKLELSIIRDYWYSLSPAEQTDTEFYKMVLATENVMFAQNGEWLRSMQEALAGAEDEDKKLVEQMVKVSTSAHTDLQQKLLTESQSVFAQATEQLSAVAEDAATTVSNMVTAVSGEAMALNQAMEDALNTTVSQSAAVRQSITESVDAVAAEAEATRTTMESGRDAALTEISAWQAAAEAATSEATAQAAAARAAGVAAVAAETAGWGESAQSAVEVATTKSAAMRDLAETIVVTAEETGGDARAAVADEAAAWQEMGSDVVNATMAESANLRATASDTVKFAVDFVPVSEMAMEAATAVSETGAETIYSAVPDVKYAIQFHPPDATPEATAVALPPVAEIADDAVDKAVHSLLEQGIQVADENIKQALAKATQQEEQQ